MLPGIPSDSGVLLEAGSSPPFSKNGEITAVKRVAQGCGSCEGCRGGFPNEF